MLSLRDRLAIRDSYFKARKQIMKDCGYMPEDTTANFINFLSGNIKKIDDGVYILTIKEEKQDG